MNLNYNLHSGYNIPLVSGFNIISNNNIDSNNNIIDENKLFENSFILNSNLNFAGTKLFKNTGNIIDLYKQQNKNFEYNNFNGFIFYFASSDYNGLRFVDLRLPNNMKWELNFEITPICTGKDNFPNMNTENL